MMSHRGSRAGPSRRSIVNKGNQEDSGPQMMDPSQMAADSIPDIPISGLAVQPESTKKKTELMSITDKISKALKDFDNLYDDNKSGNTMLDDLALQVSDLEGGPLKMQLKNFINDYKTMSSELAKTKTQRDEALENLAEWFTSDHLGMDYSLSFSTEDEEEFDKGVREGLVSARMGIDKLQRLNHEMIELKRRGTSTADLDREREKLQEEIMRAMKEYNEVNKDKMDKQKAAMMGDDMSGAWKSAAGEICGLLKKVRDQGSDYVTELEDKVNEMAKNMEREGMKVAKLQITLRQAQQLESRLKDDNTELMKQKARAEARVKKLKKQLGAQQSQSKNNGGIGQEMESQAEAQDLETNFAQGTAGCGPEAMIFKTQLRECQKQLDAITMEHNDLQEKHKENMELLEEKDDQIESLLHDKAELLAQMKKASLATDTRHLSDSNTGHDPTHRGSIPNASFGGAIHGNKMSVSNIGGHTCSHCHCHVSSRRGSTGSLSGSKHKSINVSSQESGPAEALKKKEEMVRQLMQRCEHYEKSLTLMHQKLVKAKQNKTAAEGGSQAVPKKKSKKSSPSAQVSEKQPQQPAGPASAAPPAATSDALQAPASQEAAAPEPVTSREDTDEETKQEKPVSAESSKEEITFDEDELEVLGPILNKDGDLIPFAFTPRALMVSVSVQAHPMVASNSVDNVQPKQNTGAEISSDPILCATRGMQTDPKLDPLSAWAMGSSNDRGWKPPMPPSSWIEYDPTMIPSMDQAGSDNVPTVVDAMMKGEDPSLIRKETMTAANFIGKELERMIMGIQGFVEYTNKFIDRDATLMAATNQKLKQNLSSSALAQLEKELQRPPSTDLFGEEMEHIPGLNPLQMQKRTISTAGASLMEKNEKSVFMWPTAAKEPATEYEEDESSVKLSVQSIAQGAIETLRQTYILVLSNLHTQQHVYEQIYGMLQKREGAGILRPGFPRPSDGQDAPYDLQPKRSVSDSVLDMPMMTSKPVMQGSIAFHPRKSRPAPNPPEPFLTKTNLGMNLPPSQDMTPQVPGQDYSNTYKEMKVARATIPKNGMIKLISLNQSIPETKGNDFFGSHFERQRPKHRPAPMNHQKLVLKQKAVFQKTSKPSRQYNKAVHGQSPQQHKNTSQAEQQPYIMQLAGVADPVYGEEFAEENLAAFTMRELEQRAEQVAEKKAREHKLNFIDIVSNDRSTTLLPHAKSNIGISDQVSLPPISSKQQQPGSKLPPLKT